MAQFSRIKVWNSGEVLYAADLNNEFNNLLNGFTPNMIDGASAFVSNMQSTVAPGNVGSESLASNLLGEVQRLRYTVQGITGAAQWYVPPSITLAATNINLTSLNNYFSNVKKTDGSDPGVGGTTYVADSYTLAINNSGPATLNRLSNVCLLSTHGRIVEVNCRAPIASGTTSFMIAEYSSNSTPEKWTVLHELLKSTDVGVTFTSVDSVYMIFTADFGTSGAGFVDAPIFTSGIFLYDYAPVMVSGAPIQYRIKTTISLGAGIHTTWEFRVITNQIVIAREI